MIWFIEGNDKETIHRTKYISWKAILEMLVIKSVKGVTLTIDDWQFYRGVQLILSIDLGMMNE